MGPRNMWCAVLLLAAGVAAKVVYLEEHFGSKERFAARWVPGAVLKGTPALGRWAVSPQTGLITLDKERFYALSARLDAEIDNRSTPLVVQLSVRYPEASTCGGGYIKLHTDAQLPDQASLAAATPYVLLFGPDFCGATRKLQIEIGRSGKHYAIKKTIDLPQDLIGVTHLYTLVLRPDNSYTALIDNVVAASGTIEDDWNIVAPRRIADPTATKPADWIDDPEMDDPSDTQPSEWNAGVPEYIVDNDAEAPSDWDDEAEGRAWPPRLRNPEHKGQWKPRRIPNPLYKGPWSVPMIDNPEHVSDPSLHDISGASIVGLELWEVQNNVRFGNMLMTDDVEYAKTSSENTWRKVYVSDSEFRARAIAEYQAKYKAQIAEQQAKEQATHAENSFDEL